MTTTKVRTGSPSDGSSVAEFVGRALNEVWHPATIPPAFLDEISFPPTVLKAVTINMGLKRDNLEWQLSRATTALTSYEAQLDQAGVAADQRAANAKWRNLNAKCRSLRNRLCAVSKIEKNNADVAQRKSADESAE
jgi:hypothetical protein